MRIQARAGILVTAAAVAALGGCSWFGHRGAADPGPRVADLVDELPALQLPAATADAPTREEVMAAYRRIYGELPDRGQDRAVGKRLADLSMGEAEDRAVAGEASPYDSAIALYESLLDQGGKDQDEILYQLARAYDLAGRNADSRHCLDRLIAEHPDSRYVVEARFRRAEMAFSQAHYADAAADYGFVVSQGRGTPYWQNASYMRGWSLFKRSQLDEALASFFDVIASLVPDGKVDALPAADRELLHDTLRVVTLAVGYLDGPATLAARMRGLGRPPWQYLAYQALADSYHQRERYLDSVATWQTFIHENPLDPRAPAAHLGMIDTLIAADFPSEVEPQKEAFVTSYGIHSRFWAAHGPEVRETYLKPLQRFLVELAQRRHAEAQQSHQRKAYLAAARWYQELLDTFPGDPRSAEYLFLLGEVYTEAGEDAQAVAAYQRVVHEFPDSPHANEAGYAAILGLEKLVKRASGAELARLQRTRIDAQTEFAAAFPQDSRAPAVQTDAADGLFQLGEYEKAVGLAEDLLASWPDLAWPLRRTALTIEGHGRFELGRYAQAEEAYRALLAGPLPEEERGPLTQRLLAAVYEQGQAAEKAGDTEAAVQHYLRMSAIDPKAELAVKGEFDAVAVAESAGQTARAASLLVRFRNEHPHDPLAQDAGKRLAAMYEKTGDLPAAAAEYTTLAEHDPDAEVRRQSLYRAGELYLEKGDVSDAIERFRDYAHNYPEPIDQRLEAVDHLDRLYQRTGDGDKRRYWLRQKIDIQREMGAAATERASYLAAEAQYVLAGDARAAFEAVQLTQPLKRSLARKQRALKDAVKAYEAVADYGVADFATASTYQLATLFTDLAHSIMASDRPHGLSDLEREQYEVLLEEQAYPFEEKAISLHEINMRRSWQGLWDDWIEKSFVELARLMPARFDKSEVEVAYVDNIH